MYLNILKNDLKRKKAMNVILLAFIILATMFVSSSVNNIVSVTSALDNYLEIADAPDYFAATMNKALSENIEKVLSTAEAVDSLSKEKIIYMSQSNINGDNITMPVGTHILQSDSDMSINYFLDDNAILHGVEKGFVYIIESSMEKAGLKKGDIITIEIEGISKDFTVAGGIKDAVLGSGQLSMTRYIINEEDFEEYISVEKLDKYYGGELIYIKTSDIDKLLAEIADAAESFVFVMDKAMIKFTYIFDMIVTGILLVVSLILIAIAFVVLRFTISFTLSEEFREIGVMKAIGIGNMKIRGLYLVKYAALSVIGSVIGLALSFPFGELLMSVSSKSVIIGNENAFFVNIICSLLVVTVILLFCFGCTGKVKKMTPIDAIRNGQTGERFRKKSIMSLGKSKLGTTAFLAANDIVSSPKRFTIITLTFFLCLSLLLMLSATVSTLKSDSLIGTFGLAHCDVAINGGEAIMEFMVDGGREKMTEYLDDMEQKLAENGIPAKCIQELWFYLTVTHGENSCKINTYQGTGTTMDMYEYTAGTAPRNSNEIAITRIAAESLNANIGDTVTIKTIDGEKNYIITAFFQSMNTQGSTIRLYTDEYINYAQSAGGIGTQIIFTDSPDEEETALRIEKIKELYPEFTEVLTCSEWVQKNVGVADTLDSVKQLVAILTVVLTALITVLMERSFIAKEQGEIALMKAIGTKNSKIYAYHATRFAIVGIIAVIIGEILAMPLTHLCIDPIFRMMGMELAVDYVINPVEMYIIFPVIVLATTIISAFLTSLYTRKIKSSDTANIE
ncbi:MAG: FtsX-like permease family protein [Ruminiclostridium sp.]